MGTRWTVYGRQSKGNKVSINQQLTTLTNEAEHNGGSVLITLTDAVSASKFARVQRKDWPDVLKLIEHAETDVLALWEVSRGERRATPWSALLDLCAKMKVKIWISTHERLYDPNNDADWEALAREGISAEMESRKTSKRTLRDAAHSAAKGLPDGKNLFGYKRIRAEDGTLQGVEIVKDQADVVREAAKRFAKGDSLRSIAKDLESRGVVGLWGNPMGPTQIRRMLSNKSYLGIRTHHGVEHPGVWEAILSQETFDICQARFADPARKNVKDDPNHTTRRDGKFQHLLSGIARCAVCGAPLRLNPSGAKRVLYYRCPVKNHVGIKQSDLDDYVTAEVKTRIFKIREEPRFDAKAEALREVAKAEVTQLEAEIAELTEQIKARRISALVAGPVSLDLEQRLEDAKRRANAATPLRMVRFLSNDGTSFDDRPMEQQRELVRNLVTVTVKPVGMGKRNVPIEARVSVEDQELEEMAL